MVCTPGLVFNELPAGADSTQQRLALLFFVLLLYQLLPFCFMSFFSADRQFFIKDIAAELYAPSAYYLAAVSSSEIPCYYLPCLVAYGSMRLLHALRCWQGVLGHSVACHWLKGG